MTRERAEAERCPVFPDPEDSLPLVLVIDDDAQAMHTASFILRRAGFRVKAVGSAETGVFLARELRPEVIVCDANLRGIDGSSVLSRLKRAGETSGIPVILMSQCEHLHCEGMFTFLRKPSDLAALGEAARNALLMHAA